MIPVSLEMENFYSHSQSKIDFNFSSALIIGENDDDQDKSNGSGKSSIFEAIGWALFNESRTKAADAVIKRGKSGCKVIFIFEHDNKKYKIIRTRSAKYAAQNSVEFFQVLDDGKEIQIKADTNSELDRKIRDTIKSNYKVFINSSYFRQSDLSSFLNGTSSDRQKIVSSILNLDRWDKYMKGADKKAKDLEKEVSIIKYKLSEFGNLDKDISSTEVGLKASQDEVNSLASKEEALNEAIKSLELKVSNIKMKDNNLSDYQNNKSKLDYISSKILELSRAERDKLSQIEVSRSELAKNVEAISHAEKMIEDLAPQLEMKNLLNTEDFERKLMKGKAKLELLSSQILNMQSNDICSACGTEWTDEHKKLHELDKKKAELSELEAKIKLADSKLNAKKEKEAEIKKIELEIEKYTTRCRNIKNSNQLHELRISSAENELDLIKKSLQDLLLEQENLQKIINDSKNIFENADFNQALKELELNKVRRKELSKRKDELLFSIGSDNNRLKTLNANKQKNKELNDQLEKLNKSLTIYSNLTRTFSRNGIQAIIIDNIMEELSKVTNEKINEFSVVPTYVDFITQKKDTKGSWKETLDIEIRTPSGISEFDSLSGGEAFRVAFAIRLALSSIQARRMGGETQLLMFDEVSTSLDKHGLETFVSIIKKLEKQVKIMVITHDDKLKEEFDHIITVKKVGDDSFV